MNKRRESRRSCKRLKIFLSREENGRKRQRDRRIIVQMLNDRELMKRCCTLDTWTTSVVDLIRAAFMSHNATESRKWDES